jgi:carbon storage regulator
VVDHSRVVGRVGFFIGYARQERASTNAFEGRGNSGPVVNRQQSKCLSLCSFAQGHSTQEATMLVLNRKRGERIMIGDDIEVTVVEVRGQRVQLGFQCPNEIPVHRGEIHRRIHTEQLSALPVELTEEWHECLETP